MYFTDEQIPHAFPVTQPGRLERIWYDSFTYDDANQPLRKDALVYLPYGYDQHPEKRYPVFYLMHGGGGNANDMFGGLEASGPLKGIVDHAIETGRTQPMIVVTPSYYVEGHEEAHTDVKAAGELTHRFPKEMKQDLVPYIDRTYRTIPERWSRAFGGFSMGSEATWSVLTGCLREVAVYLPMSGDYWAFGVKASKEKPRETVDALLGHIRASGVTPGDYRIHAFTGTEDIAFEAMDPMLHEMEKRQPWFTPGVNLMYCLKPGAYHDSESCMEYITMALPILFPM